MTIVRIANNVGEIAIIVEFVPRDRRHLRDIVHREAGNVAYLYGEPRVATCHIEHGDGRTETLRVVLTEDDKSRIVR